MGPIFRWGNILTQFFPTYPGTSSIDENIFEWSKKKDEKILENVLNWLYLNPNIVSRSRFGGR